jgi:methyl-accepting chemotaxis protein
MKSDPTEWGASNDAAGIRKKAIRITNQNREGGGMNTWQKLSMRGKLRTLGLSGVAFIGGVLLFGLWVIERQTTRHVTAALHTETELQTTRIVEGVYNMIKTQDQLLRIKLAGDLSVARDLMDRIGPVNFLDEPVIWEVINQFNRESRRARLPKMRFGDEWLGQNYEPGQETLLVDHVQSLVGGTCTVFQRMNEAGDMLRVATNVIDNEQARAIGTYIPAVNPDGQPNPVISTVLRGEMYSGRAYVVNDWYVTAYEPIRNTDGDIVGVLYVGIPMETVTDLRQAILDIPVGETGYVFVLGGSGNHRGHYLISKQGERDGENIWEAKDSDGRFFIRDMIQQALAGSEGQNFIIQYPWQNIDEQTPRLKFSSVTYYRPWDWVIGAGSYWDEFETGVTRLITAIRQMITFLVIAILTTLGIAWFLSMRAARDISRPIRLITAGAHHLATGDVSLSKLDPKAIAVVNERPDELGEIGRAFDTLIDYTQRKVAAVAQIARGDFALDVPVASDSDTLGQALRQMLASLAELITQTRETAEQVAIGSGQVRESSQLQSQNATENAASLEEISSSLTELDAQTKANAENADRANRISASSRTAVERGVHRMQELMAAMQAIDTASQKIGKIIKTIDEIAFQTNLLALNAAVEAARAGRYGKGFAVVAEEVRSLAGRCAKAAKETAELIAGSTKTVSTGGKLARQTQEALNEIAAHIAQTTDLVAEIAVASSEQSEGISQVNQGLGQVDRVIQLNTANAETMATAAEELSGQANQLRELLSQFHLRTDDPPLTALVGRDRNSARFENRR